MGLLETLSHIAAAPAEAPRGEFREVELPEPVPLRRAPGIVLHAAPRASPVPTPLAPDQIKTILDHADRTPDSSRLGRGNYVHVSTLVNLCPRQYYLAHEHGSEDYADHLGQSWTGGHLVTFAMGHGAEGHVKRQLLRSVRDRVYGLWKCRCRRTSRLGMYEGNTVCDRCGFPVDQYDEPVLRNEEYRIIGRPDISLLDNTRHMIVVEIKTMARSRWEELAEPLADHQLQGLLYNWLYRQVGRQVNPTVVFVYITKDFRYGSPYKEFHIDAESEQSRRLLDVALGLATQLRDARATHVAPPRTLCGDVDCARARDCPVRTLCFNME